MLEPIARLEKKVQRFALAIAAVVALLIPAGYVAVSYVNHAESANFKARVKSAALTDLIASNPDTWMFAENRLRGLLSRDPVPLEHELVQVLDATGTLLVGVGSTPPSPVLTRAYPLFDSGRIVGRVVVSISLRDELEWTLPVFLLSLLVSAAVYAVTKVLPLRALRQATAAVRENELRFRSLFENVPNIAVQGVDNHQRVIYWNAASERLYGYATHEAMGRNLTTLTVPLPMRPAVSAAVDAWMAGGPPIPPAESTLQRKDGFLLPVFSSHTMLRNAAGLPELYRIDVELTELKRTEAALRAHQAHLEDMVQARTRDLSIARDAAEAANRAKSTFLANMSHELRTPMNGVMGMIDLVSRRTTDERSRDQLAKAQGSAQKLLGIINDILDLSKIEADRMKLETRGLRIRDVLDGVRDVIGPMAAENGLDLRFDVPPELAGRSLRGDPLRLGQVLLNLAGNAVKFTPRGSIDVSVRVVEELPATTLIRFEVADTGIGIHPQELARLFNAFEQADGSMTRRYGGAGLGLAISRQLTRMMGGEIGVESIFGQGSRFWFTARLDNAPAAVEAPAPATVHAKAAARLAREFAGARILLAEDEPINREVSSLLLREIGLDVELAEDGAQALALARRQRFDLILMDVRMPNLNGIDAARAIRADSGNAGTPIVALTANAFDDDREACMAAGMNDYIAKPVVPDVLCETLVRWLETCRSPAARLPETALG